MKTKTIITAIILLFSLTSFAQTKKELTKEETVKYLNDVNLKQSRVGGNVSLDGKILIVTGLRKEIMIDQPLIIKKDAMYQVIFKDGQYAIFYTDLESDAQRMKNALEHLIKLLKAEPETDPFAN
ncbi:hypothetical protein [Soonwooa purpurea]